MRQASILGEAGSELLWTTSELDRYERKGFNAPLARGILCYSVTITIKCYPFLLLLKLKNLKQIGKLKVLRDCNIANDTAVHEMAIYSKII